MKLQLLFVLWLLATCSVVAQTIDHISITTYHLAYALPSVESWKMPVHPGLEIGMGKPLRSTERSTQWLYGKAGGYYHQDMEAGVYLGAAWGYRYRLFGNAMIEGSAGLSYLHSFFPGTVYEYDDEQAALIPIKQWGRPHLLPEIGLEASYALSRWQPTIGYRLRIETFFANSIPVIPQTLLTVGVRYQFAS